MESDELARPDTMFWIASMTKAVVSVGALQLIERGQLELEQLDPTVAQRDRLMAIHDARAGRPLKLSSIAPPTEPEMWSAGAGLYSTASDYLRFMRALLRGGELDGKRILRPETVKLAFTDHLQGAPLPADGTHSAISALTNDVPALPFQQGFGLGFSLLLEDIPGMRRAGTGNWAGLCNTYFWVDHSSGIAATLMTQILPFFDPGVVQTLLGFEAAVYAT